MVRASCICSAKIKTVKISSEKSGRISMKFCTSKNFLLYVSGEIPSGVVVMNEGDVAGEERLVGKLDFHSHVKRRIRRYTTQAGGSIGCPM